MIENIYSTGDKSSEKINVMFRLPKNIRQIGQINENQKIYVEDYVMTYIKQISSRCGGPYKMAVLLGNFMKNEGCKNTFISGAVEVRKTELEDSTFTNEEWSHIYEDIKKYFTDVEIVGWFITRKECAIDVTDEILRIHIDNFAGQNKTLLVHDCLEQEEAFYVYEDTRLVKQKGYYIYYERNEEMQNYMVENKNIVSEEVEFEDRAAKEIRTIIENKKGKEPHKYVEKLLYAASTFLAIVVLVIGATMLNNYDQMRNMQQSLNNLTNTIIGEKETLKPSNSKSEIDKATVEPNVEENIGDSIEDLSIKENKDALVTEVETVLGNINKINKEYIEDIQKTVEPKASNSVEETKKPASDNNKSQNQKTQTTEKPKTLAKNNSNKKKVYHTVKAGETLAEISYKYYKSTYKIENIIEANEIEDQNYIFEGQKLLIP